MVNKIDNDIDDMQRIIEGTKCSCGGDLREQSVYRNQGYGHWMQKQCTKCSYKEGEDPNPPWYVAEARRMEALRNEKEKEAKLAENS